MDNRRDYESKVQGFERRQGRKQSLDLPACGFRYQKQRMSADRLP